MGGQKEAEKQRNNEEQAAERMLAFGEVSCFSELISFWGISVA